MTGWIPGKISRHATIRRYVGNTLYHHCAPALAKP
jgi:hypothetical protein